MPINYKDYPPEFPEISARLREGRANNRCEECGAENHLPHPDTGSIVVLTTAHLNHIKDDIREENLKVLCQRCHLRLDLSRHIFNRVYGSDTRRLNCDLFEGTEYEYPR